MTIQFKKLNLKHNYSTIRLVIKNLRLNHKIECYREEVFPNPKGPKEKLINLTQRQRKTSENVGLQDLIVTCDHIKDDLWDIELKNLNDILSLISDQLSKKLILDLRNSSNYSSFCGASRERCFAKNDAYGVSTLDLQLNEEDLKTLIRNILDNKRDENWIYLREKVELISTILCEKF